ncbi:hypothetical protein FB45DRAFT_1063116 [Roridomyces roridus]|uniref:Uncharacterized protein n=1 Tax=Roridomyces roridus TaxID=1738132 RepID=A0AAD7BDU9_9AGAR|nr:hypothetical protein FB45DRAFT_1063116 [Roridomyces roridus]
MTRTQHLQGLLPNIQRICFNIWLFLRSQTSAYVPMIMGPAAIYSATSLFQLALFFLFQVAPTMRILRKVFLYRHRRALSVIICLLIWDAFSAFILYSSARATFMTVELPNLDNISRSRILELEPQALWSAEAGAQIWELYQPSLELYRYWRMGQTRELRRLTRFLWITIVELSRCQQMLILAPIVVLYGFFYIKPVVKKIVMRIRYWHWRNQRERERYRAISKLG